MTRIYRGYILYEPTSGGKAGKGCNVTSSIQIRVNIPGGRQIVAKNIRYKTGDFRAYATALTKAKQFVNREIQDIFERNQRS